jgi:sulfite reductase (ferredoxin)
VLLGGGIVGNGVGRTADKVIKIPSKKAKEVLRTLLNDYAANAAENEAFNQYYDRQGNKYFYGILKPFASLEDIKDEDYVDWGREVDFVPAIGTGECASVVIDLVGALLTDATEKLTFATEAVEEDRYADGIYYAYSSFIHVAKALLLDRDVACNTHLGILNDFDTHYGEEKAFSFPGGFKEFVLRINKHEPEHAFAEAYLSSAREFLDQAKAFREAEVTVS